MTLADLALEGNVVPQPSLCQGERISESPFTLSIREQPDGPQRACAVYSSKVSISRKGNIVAESASQATGGVCRGNADSQIST